MIPPVNRLTPVLRGFLEGFGFVIGLVGIISVGLAAAGLALIGAVWVWRWVVIVLRGGGL